MTTDTAVPTTDQILVDMLTENTGRALCDSGDAYGRAWEHNQGKTLEAFQAAPEAFLDKYSGFTLDVFHFLSDRLDFDPEMDALFAEFDASRPDDGWMTIMEEFPQWVADTHPELCDGEVSTCTVNTYNGEDALTQTIQYTLFSLSGHDACYGEFVALQIHGGCDVRGGYTKPRIFRTGEAALMDNACGSIYCTAPDADSTPVTLPGLPEPQKFSHVWDTTDAGYEWYDEVNYPDRLPSIGGYNRPENFQIEPDDDGVFHCPVPGCTGTLSVCGRPAG